MPCGICSAKCRLPKKQGFSTYRLESGLAMRFGRNQALDLLEDVDDPAFGPSSEMVARLGEVEPSKRAEFCSETAEALAIKYPDSPKAWLYVSQLRFVNGDLEQAMLALLKSYSLKHPGGPRAKQVRLIQLKHEQAKKECVDSDERPS